MDYRENTRKMLPEELASCIEESTIHMADEYTCSPEVLKVGEAVIGTLGNFSASIGKAKSKKTFNVSAIVASALSNDEVLRYNSDFPSDKRYILYIDTEQGRHHCQKVLKRIVRLANLPIDIEPDNLKILALRKYTPEERLAIVEYALNVIPNIGLVIIDGIRDFVYDINSPSEATKIISKLMQWTDDYQIHIHTILHQNKNDEHARGHIGTELNNKAETIMQIEVDKDDKSVSVVEAIHIRDKEFEPFAFRINDEALPELVECYSPKEKKVGRPKKEEFDPYRDIPETVHRQVLETVFSNGNIKGYDEFKAALKSGYANVGYKLGHNKLVTLMTFLNNKRMVVKVEKAYHFMPDYHY
jgi:hypothetical protein